MPETLVPLIVMAAALVAVGLVHRSFMEWLDTGGWDHLLVACLGAAVLAGGLTFVVLGN